MNFKRSFTPLAMVLACAAPLAAQETVGTLVGTVLHSGTGKPLAGAKLILRSAKMLGDRTATTGADGAFRIPLLPNGEYTLTTNTEGFNSSTVRFAITPGQTTRQNVRLAPIQTVTVEVVADSAAQVDKTETTSQTIFSMDSIKALTGGDLTRIAEIAPAVVLGSTAKGTTIAVRGGNTTGARMLLNGLDAGDPGWGTFDPNAQMVSEMVETVAVISSPLNARYGNTESGMLSYVTTRGSNDFKGSIRTTYSVGGTYGASATTSRYQPRYGADSDLRYKTPGSGAASRNWEATISGPIWKDHITFAWGGRFYPNTTSSAQVSKLWLPDSHDYASSWGGVILPLSDGLGQIRRGEIYDTGKFYNTTTTQSFNQYALFWQINANHSIDWTYSEYKNDYTGLADGSLDLHSKNYYNSKEGNRVWNLSYKGLVGPGVLEARLGRTVNEIVRPDTSGDEYANISVGTVSSYYNTNFTADSNLTYSDLNGQLYPNQNLFEARKENYQTTFTVSGSPYDRGESKSNTSFFANYQVAAGSHLVDVGVNYVKTHWDTALGSADTVISGTGGQIATDLTDSDMLYPTGYTGVRDTAKNYAGKWIVWDAHALTTRLYPNYPDPTGQNQYAYSALGAATMTRYYGQENGAYDEETKSFYANDIWSYSNRFTFMGGLRYDKFNLSDSTGSVLSYGVLSPRFQVKYDINGDQKRVISYSWAKFHNRMPSAAFLSLVKRRKAYSITKMWDGNVTDGGHVSTGVDSTGTAYDKGFQLVSTEQLKDPNNYSYYTAQNNPDIYKLDSNFRADYNVEQVLAFQRAYDNGSNWKASVIYRKWFNNYQWFMDPHASIINNPYAPVSDTSVSNETNANYTTHRVLRNDSGLFHTYHSFELEWNFVLSHTVTLSGNYAYSRNYSNQMYYAAQTNYSEDNVGVKHSPWGINLPEVWALVGLSLDDIAQKSVVRDQVANAWVTWDLSSGALKQTLVFRSHWDLGGTYTMWNQGSTINTNSTAWKAILAHANVGADFPTALNITQNYGNSMYLAYPGTNIGDNKGTDNITFTLKYNLEVPITAKLRWWVGVEIFNVFNQAYETNQIDYQGSTVSSDAGAAKQRSDVFRVDGSQTGPLPAANGYRMSTSAMMQPVGSYVDGGRYFALETGIRF